jgi:TolB protein
MLLQVVNRRRRQIAMLRKSRLALIVPLLAALLFAFSQPPAGATFPGKNGRIAFEDYVGSEHIFTVNPDGSDATDLTPGFEASSPEWSPDGTKIAFNVFLGPPSNGIWVMNADGSNKWQLTDDGGWAPSYSPDGSHIAYVCCNDGLIVMRADGTHRRTIVHQQSPSQPQFSPDGTTIAYAQGYDIWVVSRDGSNRHRLTKGFPSDASPSWSPDGTRIAFHRSGTGPHSQDVWVMNADGTNPTNVTENLVDGTVFIEPAWSPDGTKLALTRYDADCYGGGLITINLDGTDVTSVFCLYDAHNSAWQSLP